MNPSCSRRSTFVIALLLSTSFALAQPYAGMPIRIGTWNVHPTNIGPQTADARIANILAFGQQHNVDIVALQEVPRALLQDQGRLAALHQAAQNAGYHAVIAWTEYPANGMATTATRQQGYVVFFNPARLALNNQNPNAPPFYQPNQFLQGAAQARPPIVIRFNVHHPNRPDTALSVLSWHNEAGTMARARVEGMGRLIEQELEPRRAYAHEDWVLVGDFNIGDTTQEVQELDQRYDVLTHDQGIDHIVTNSGLTNIINDDPAANIDPQFRSTGRHLALFGEIRCGRQ